MAEDLEGLLDTSEGGSETGATNESESQGTTPAQPPKIDLSKVPEYTRIQSERDTLKAQLERERAQTERERADKVQQLELERQRREALEGLVNNLDPDKAEAYKAHLDAQTAKTENELLKQRLQAYEAREQQNETRRAWEQAAAEAGIDPSSAKFQDAWGRAVQRNSPAPLEAMLEVQAALKAATIAAPAPAPVQEDTVPGKGYSLPPQGVPPVKPLTDAERAVMEGQVMLLQKEPTKNKEKIAELMKRLGL